MPATNSAELQLGMAHSPSHTLSEVALESVLARSLPSAVTAPKAPSPEDTYAKFYDPEDPTTHCEVKVTSSVTLEDIARVTPPEDMERLYDYAEEMKGKRIVRVNATAAGGGVAIMNSPWVHLMQELGVNASWHALKPDPEAAEVTKGKFHNVLQNVAGEGVRLTEEDKEVYENWIAENVPLLEEPLREAAVIIIDDWQPSRLIKYIKGFEEQTEHGPVFHLGINPNAKILFRDHIHTRADLMGKEGTPQHTTWKYLWEDNQINKADVFIVHPKPEFVPPDVPDDKVVYMPATCDLLDDLNRQLSEEERRKGIAFINEHLAETDGQLPIDPDRPYIALVARFDGSKGMPQGMESYAKARQLLLDQGVKEADLPQFVLIGNGSIDDPDGPKLKREMLDLRAGIYADIKDDIKIVRVPHNDAAINAIVGGAKIAYQPSTAEGFESRVTDAILQGVPVIGSDRGGIPLQIEEGRSGYVIDPYDTDEWARRTAELLTDEVAYAEMRRTTLELARSKNYAFTTVPNVLRWLWLSSNVKPGLQGNQCRVDELMAYMELGLEDQVFANN